MIRGLCKASLLDRLYVYGLHEGGGVLYMGITNSVIWYNLTRHEWIWVTKRHPESVATSGSASTSFFLGLNKVNFAGSSDVCVEGKEEKVLRIKATTCLDGEYTCDDGHCVPIDQRCDQTPNCADGSDESHCKMLSIQDSYNKKIPPFRLAGGGKIVPIEISVSISILEFLKISEVDHEYRLKFTFVMEWNDHRLNYYNLKTRMSANAFTAEEVNKMWIPHLVFSNNEDNLVTQVQSWALAVFFFYLFYLSIYFLIEITYFFKTYSL